MEWFICCNEITLSNERFKPDADRKYNLDMCQLGHSRGEKRSDQQPVDNHVAHGAPRGKKRLTA